MADNGGRNAKPEQKKNAPQNGPAGLVASMAFSVSPLRAVQKSKGSACPARIIGFATPCWAQPAERRGA